MEKKMLATKPGTINQIVKEARDMMLKREDVVCIIQTPNGFILVYFG